MSGLTAVLSQQTTVPAPDVNSVPNPGGGASTFDLQPSKERHVTVDVCSEFMSYTAPVNVISSKDDIELVQDTEGQPIILALSGDQQRLLALVHVNGGPIAYQPFDISPGDPSSHVNAFSIYQDVDHTIHIVASVLGDDGLCDVYIVSVDLPRLAWNEDLGKVEGFDVTGMSLTRSRWILTPNNLGRKAINSLSIGPSSEDDDAGNGHQLFRVVAGSHSAGQSTGTHYVLNASSSAKAGDSWRILPLPQTAQSVLEIKAGNLQADGPGVFSRFERANGATACVFDAFNGISYNINTDGLGMIRGIFANINPWGDTDLLVASDGGLGFYNNRHIDEAPQLLLPGIAFKQVVSAEAVPNVKHLTSTVLTIFAVSEHDELYFIEGIRPFKTNIVRFQTSAIPIRVGVERISPQYNKKVNTAELIYVGNGQDEIWHLWKDPTTFEWREDNVAVKSTGKIESYAAYHTVISFNDDLGNSLVGYEFGLRSTFATVLVNGRTHILDASSTAFETDLYGKCSIVARTDETLGAAKYEILLTQFTPPHSPTLIDIEPKQRVVRALANIHTSSDISNAKSTAGVPIFIDHPAQSGDYDLAAAILGSFGDMAHAVDPATTHAIIGGSTKSTDLTVAWQKDSNGKVTRDDNNWIENAVDAVEHFFGDMLEAARSALVAVTKIACKVVGPVLTIFFKIAGKVFRFVVTHIGPLVRCFAVFLKDVLGIDISGFLDWLGFVFDFDRIKQTQQILIDGFQTVISTSQQFVRVNRPVLSQAIDTAKAKIEKIIPDHRPPIEDTYKNTIDSANSTVNDVLGFLLNSPVINVYQRYNPVTIVLETIGNEIGDSIKLPDLSSLSDILTHVIGNLLEDELDNLVRLFQDIGDKFQECFDGRVPIMDGVSWLLEDTLWTLIDSIKLLAMAIFDAFADVLEAGSHVLTDPWTIPLITELWTDFTDQDFSILNVVTMVIATGMNLYCLSVDGKMPFDEQADPKTFFSATDDQLDLGKVFDLPSSKSLVTKDQAAGKKISNGFVPSKMSLKVKNGLEAHMSQLHGRTITIGSQSHNAAQKMNRNNIIMEAPDTPAPNTPVNGSGDTEGKKALDQWKRIDVGLSLAGRLCNTVIVTWECINHLAEIGRGRNAPWPADPNANKFKTFFSQKGNKRVAFLQRKSWTKRWGPKMYESDKLFTTTFDFLQMAGRIAQVTVLLVFNGKSSAEDFKSYVDHDGVGAAYIVLRFLNAALSGAALGFRSPKLERHQSATASGASRWESIGNGLNSVVSLLDSAVCGCILEYGVIAKGERDNESKELFAASVFEVVGSLASIVAESCHQSVQKDFNVYAVVPMLAANGTDVGTSLAAVGLNALVTGQL